MSLTTIILYLFHLGHQPTYNRVVFFFFLAAIFCRWRQRSFGNMRNTGSVIASSRTFHGHPPSIASRAHKAGVKDKENAEWGGDDEPGPETIFGAYVHWFRPSVAPLGNPDGSRTPLHKSVSKWSTISKSFNTLASTPSSARLHATQIQSKLHKQTPLYIF